MIAVTSNWWHLQLPKQLFLNLHRPNPMGYVCINSWHQAASPSTSGSPRYLYISRLESRSLIISANNCTSTYSNTHPKRRPPITPTCLSTLGHAFGKGLHHNSQAEGLIYAQIVSSPQLQLIKSIASILMHQLHPQYQQDRWWRNTLQASSSLALTTRRQRTTESAPYRARLAPDDRYGRISRSFWLRFLGVRYPKHAEGAWPRTPIGLAWVECKGWASGEFIIILLWMCSLISQVILSFLSFYSSHRLLKLGHMV